LAAGAAFAIWTFGRRVPTGKRKAVRAKRQIKQAAENEVSVRSTE